jgi:hypothetical protein
VDEAQAFKQTKGVAVEGLNRENEKAVVGERTSAAAARFVAGPICPA